MTSGGACAPGPWSGTERRREEATGGGPAAADATLDGVSMPGVIELGVDEGVPERQRQPPVRGRHWWNVGLLIVLALATLGSSGLGRPVLTAVATVHESTPMMNYQVDRDVMYTFQGAYATGTRKPLWTNLTAISLSDGHAYWRTQLGIDSSGAFLRVIGNVLVISVLDPEAESGGTIALSAEDGSQLWANSAPLVYGAHADKLVLLGGYEAGDGTVRMQPPEGQAETAAETLRAVDPETGKVVWSYLAPPGWTVDTPADPEVDRAVAMGPDGRAQSVDLATGTVRETGRFLPGTLNIVGDLAIVSHDENGEPVLSAYRVDTLDPVWTVPAPALRPELIQCGEVLCVGDTRSLWGVDPKSGTVSWRTTGWQYWYPMGSWILVTSQDRLSAKTWLLDPGTGRVLPGSEDWTPAASPGGALYALRPDRITGRLWFGAWDSAGGQFRTLGGPPLPVRGCTVGTGYLVCQRDDQTLGIWRYRT